MTSLMQKFPIYGILFFALFGGLIITLGIPDYFAVITELLIYLLLLIALSTSRFLKYYVPKLWYGILFMVLIAICSAILNESPLTHAIFSLRLIFRFYFLFVSITILNFDDEQLKAFNLFIALLLIMQLPVVGVKFYLYGISEKTQGAYAVHDGSMSTMLPIVIIFYLSSYFFLYKPKISYAIFGILTILFSIAGKKRAIFYLYPVQFFAIYYYIVSRSYNIKFTKKVAAIVTLASLTLIISGVILFINDTMNPEQEVGGTVSPAYALNFGKSYTFGVDGYGYSYGRAETSKRIATSIFTSDIVKMFFGNGPGSTTKSIFQNKEEKKQVEKLFDELKISYGFTSMSKMALEYGLLGVFVYSIILIMFAKICWNYYKIEADPYWQGFAAGSVGFAFSFLFFAFTYHHTAVWGDVLPALYFYAMSVVSIRYDRILLSHS